MEGKEKFDIQHPEAWELLVSIEDKRVDYILFSPSVPGSLAIGQVERADESLQGLEDAVYETPDLLNDYKRVRVVVHSSHFVLFPSEMSDADCQELVRHAFPDDDGDAAVCPVPGNGVKMAWLMPRGMQAFLGRTFNYPQVVHHLAPLCGYFVEHNRDDDKSRMFLHLEDERMDLAIYRDGALQCANSYPVTDDQSDAYFVLNAWRTHDLDQLTDELLMMGDSDRCAAMNPLLREYVKHVMPAVYPTAAMQLGRNAMQAPLELILLDLCE